MPRLLQQLPVLVLALSALAALNGPAMAQAPGYATIDAVEFLISDEVTPPAEDADWSTVQLPLGSRLGDEEASNRVIWLRFDLPTPEANQLLGLYFYRYNLSIDVFINGLPVGGDTYREGRQTMSWNHPRLVTIQPGTWQQGSNTVHVRFQTSYFGSTFAPILFGDVDQLQLAYEQRMFRQDTINQWMQYAGILAMLLSLALWAVRRNDRTYLLFAGMAATWIILATHMVIYYNPISYRFWLPLVHVSADLWGLFFFHLLRQLMGLKAVLATRVMNFWIICSLAWTALAPIDYWWLGAYGIHLVGQLLIFYLMVRTIRKAFTERDRLAIALCLTICVQVSFFLHDFLLVLFASPEDWESALYYSQFAFPLLMLVFAGAMLQRFISALSEAEKLNRELEDRVEASRRIIEQSFEEKHELEMKQAAARERIDIYRDLHDDVGSKLLSIVHAGNNGKSESRIGELARSALESLRNAVSRANSPEQSLNEFLLELREEAELRLTGSGHEFAWTQVQTLPKLQLSSAQVFNLNRVFRELVSNIIRHADANSVDIRVSGGIDKLNFRVADDGKGMDRDQDHGKGNGLGNIESRIAELNGSVSWRSKADRGVTVEISIPITETRHTPTHDADPVHSAGKPTAG